MLLWLFAKNILSRWLQRLLTAHVQRYRPHYRGCGHVSQVGFMASDRRRGNGGRVTALASTRQPRNAF